MLIRFTVENFLSFKSKQSLSMIPGQESLKSHHKTNAVKGVAALKMGIVLGANASGKSNLIKAMDFGRKKMLWGTKRIIDLIPFILDYTNSEKVFLIDEIDRSLHPNVVKTLFEYISETCEDAKSQVIASTHQAILLTQKIFRRDEIWFLEKNKYNSSTELYSLEDYKIRFDKEIMKVYLLGRYRGTPNIGNISDLRFSQN